MESKLDHEEQQCHYCKQWYPYPVAYYHTEAECLENCAHCEEEAD